MSVTFSPTSSIRRTPRDEPVVRKAYFAYRERRIKRMFQCDGKRVSRRVPSFDEDVPARDDADVFEPFETGFRHIEQEAFADASEVDAEIRAEGEGGVFRFETFAGNFVPS